jgi:tetratricopeptide (TPR) repeat protein
MPARTYMVIDARRDHSIRIPRPDLTLRIGTPNACNQCHSGKSAQWAADSINNWYGHAPQGFQRYADALHDSTEGAPGAQQALEQLAMNADQPAIARATALSRLSDFVPAADDPAVRSGVIDRSALIRRGTAAALSNSDPSASAETLAPLLSDPIRSVRIETANVLAAVDTRTADPRLDTALAQAINEYIDAEELNADRPESHLNLALLFAKQKKFDRAESELKTALSLDPSFVPAAVNLADLYREQGHEAQGEAVLRAAMLHSPHDPALMYGLGLSMVRQKQRVKALELFASAARTNPANARYAYVYAIALNDAGKRPEAIDTLEASAKLHPYDRDSLAALVSLLLEARRNDRALAYARRLYELEPDNQQLRQMLSTAPK